MVLSSVNEIVICKDKVGVSLFLKVKLSIYSVVFDYVYEYDSVT